MAAKKKVAPTKKMSLKPKVTSPAPLKTAPKPKPAPMMAAPVFYNEAGKPDPNGLYDRDGYMVKVPGKATKFAKADPRTEEEIRAARKAGYLR